MKSGHRHMDSSPAGSETSRENKKSGGAPWASNIGDSLDSLVEYLVDNNVEGIHPLIMGEVEKRLIIKVLERNRGNKLRAARSLGLSRNTFHRKILKLKESCDLSDSNPDS
ncbi:MAG: helix-turn-helix domain-containing protein [Syntrophaceae bacterium]|nr:helix-turn-helix domain-containing protein [Syntrophaceae bacterium]